MTDEPDPKVDWDRVYLHSMQEAADKASALWPTNWGILRGYLLEALDERGPSSEFAGEVLNLMNELDKQRLEPMQAWMKSVLEGDDE